MSALREWTFGLAVAAVAAALAACGQQDVSTTPATPAPTAPTAASPGPGSTASVVPGSTGGGNTATDICGQYYFKGIKLMEVRREGAEIVSEVRGEKDLSSGVLGKEGPEFNIDHRGRLLSATRVEFADFDLSPQSLLKHLFKEGAQAPPDAESQMAKSGMAKASGRYYDRWTLLPDGRLQVECALPILVLSFGPHMEEQVQTMMKMKENWTCGQYQKICGWKILDPREEEGWKALDGDDFARAAPLFHAAAEAQPDRPFPCVGEAWACIGAKQFDAARQALAAGEGRLNDETRPFLQQFCCMLRDQIYSYETVALGQDFPALLEQLGPKINVPQINDLFTQLNLSKRPAREFTRDDFQKISVVVNAQDFWAQSDQGVGLRGRGYLLPIGQKGLSMKTLAEVKVPDFLKAQMLAKLYLARGHLQRAPGVRRYDEAVRSYASPIRMGQLMRHGTTISHLIGVAMEGIGAGGLEQMLEDGLIADPQTLQAYQQFVTFLDQEEPRLQPYEMLASELGGGNAFISNPLLEWILCAIAVPNFMEAETRARAVTARLTMLKAASVLKTQQLAGPYAQAPDPAALPDDPFVPGQKLRCGMEGGAAIFHSLGPDQQDQQGAMRYDPTNGTASAGDLILTVR